MLVCYVEMSRICYMFFPIDTTTLLQPSVAMPSEATDEEQEQPATVYNMPD